MATTGRRILDLEKHFAFYGASHSHPVNVLIHMLFVWPIFYTSLILFHFTPPLVRFHCPLCGSDVAINLGLLVACVFGAFYMCMDRKAGSMAGVLCITCWASSDCLASRLGFAKAWKLVLGSQLLLWTGQFLGHALYEKRRPALIDNFGQALLTAPFFVLLELLRRVCGYEPSPGFHARVQARIAAAQKEPQEDNEKKNS